MPTGFDQNGIPHKPPGKKKTERIICGPYRFKADLGRIVKSANNQAVYLEEAIQEKELYSTGGKEAHLDYIFKRIEPLQALDALDQLTPAQRVELDMLNRWWEEARSL